MKPVFLICSFVLLLITIIVVLTKYDDLAGKKHYVYTKDYTEWLTGHNQNNSFYDERTFGIDLFDDSCQKMTNSDFRKFMNANVNCTGEWCSIDSKYNCKQGNNRDCYNVEHIIDKNGPEFEDCQNVKNIVANYVMAWGSWNQDLGVIASKDYESMTFEKELVYGTEIMEDVRNKLDECGCENGWSESDTHEGFINFILFSLFLLLISTVVMAIKYYKLNPGISLWPPRRSYRDGSHLVSLQLEPI